MDRITRIRIRNARAIESLDLEVSRPLTVLIGENGAGKSTIIECLELLRRAPESNFMEAFYSIHRGLPALLRSGATSLGLGVVVEDDEGELPRLDYAFTLTRRQAGAAVVDERLEVRPAPNDAAARAAHAEIARVEIALQTAEASTPEAPVRATAQQLRQLREREKARQERPQVAFDRKQQPSPTRGASVREDVLQLSTQEKSPGNVVARLKAALQSIEVHVPFDTRASWAARSYQRPESLRAATTHFPADRLSLLGFNLANAWSELRGREASHWEQTMELVRLGLGERVDSVVITPDHGGGNIYLALRFKGGALVLASDLSDGQLTWLAFVALVRLNPGRSLLAVDEPELHLHPHLLAGVISLFERIGAPVLIATHSDAILGLLDDPAKAVRSCTLDDAGRAIVASVDPEELPKWLARFGDFGTIRAEGYLSRVLAPPPPRAETKG